MGFVDQSLNTYVNALRRAALSAIFPLSFKLVSSNALPEKFKLLLGKVVGAAAGVVPLYSLCCVNSPCISILVLPVASLIATLVILKLSTNFLDESKSDGSALYLVRNTNNPKVKKPKKNYRCILYNIRL